VSATISIDLGCFVITSISSPFSPSPLYPIVVPEVDTTFSVYAYDNPSATQVLKIILKNIFEVSIDQIGCNFHTFELVTDATGATPLAEIPSSI